MYLHGAFKSRYVFESFAHDCVGSCVDLGPGVNDAQDLLFWERSRTVDVLQQLVVLGQHACAEKEYGRNIRLVWGEQFSMRGTWEHRVQSHSMFRAPNEYRTVDIIKVYRIVGLTLSINPCMYKLILIQYVTYYDKSNSPQCSTVQYKTTQYNSE